MSLKQSLIGELKHEAANTRKMLERVPMDKNDWRPHPKSMAMGRLATHVAEIPDWITNTLNADELDLAKRNAAPHVASSNEELVAILDEKVKKATETLENATDADLDKLWTMRSGEHVIFTMPKKVAIRNLAYNHQYHHRAQLGMYLRLLDVPVPGMYGPTADER